MNKIKLFFLLGTLLGAVVMISMYKVVERTSTNEYCASCHVHPHATSSWKRSPHKDNDSGVTVNCVDCHLPPKGDGYMVAKAKMGLKDLWGHLTKDSIDFNWTEKSTLEHASKHVFKASCIECHQNIYPVTLSKKGADAHLYYDDNSDELECINCHLHVGHFDPNAKKKGLIVADKVSSKLHVESTVVDKHETFIEKIPNSSISFKMVAIPGGEFNMGSGPDESFRNSDEQLAKGVKISPFFMSEVEVTWDEFLAFYAQTGAEGRSSDTQGSRTEEVDLLKSVGVDAISGATPPYGQPDQNWGLGDRPAITMSFHAAEVYCQWLSAATGKSYRLPTEAEWEYAARAGSETPYFFEGDPKDFSKSGFLNKIFGADTTNIASYTVYSGNSGGKTAEPYAVKANPFGLKNMLGNVSEFCSDWYAEDAYASIEGKSNPQGPSSGTEHVIRGGSYKSEPDQIRSAARDYTKSVAWLKTDPQMPKSIWWLSDCNTVGIRVVCDFDTSTGKEN